MPRTIILHHGILSQKKLLDTSLLPHAGYYKVIAVERTRRNSRGTTIHVSKEIRDEINLIRKRTYESCGNRLTQDDVIAHLLVAYKHCGVALCDW